MTGRLVLFAAMLALLALAFEWRPFEREPEAPAAAQARPGYYLDQVQLRDFGSDGRLRLQLLAARADEEPLAGLVRLADVRLDYHAPGGPAWQMVAAAAEVAPGGERVEFSGNVTLTGLGSDKLGAAVVRSETLSLETASEIAHTDAAVSLAFGRHTVNARGLRADLKAGTVRLESDINGRFNP